MKVSQNLKNFNQLVRNLHASARNRAKEKARMHYADMQITGDIPAYLVYLVDNTFNWCLYGVIEIAIALFYWMFFFPVVVNWFEVPENISNETMFDGTNPLDVKFDVDVDKELY